MFERYNHAGSDEKDYSKDIYGNIEQTSPVISTRQKTGFLPSLFTRLLLYLLVYTLIIETCVMLSLKGYADIIFKEDNLVEWFQLGTLVATSIFMYLASKKHSTLTDAFHVLMILPLIASARELDRFFEHLIAEVTWRILVVMLTLYLISYFWKRFYTIKKQFQEFMRTNSFGFMCSGFFIVMVFSRLFGQKVLWKTMMGEDYVRLAVRVMEEGCELVGYFFILTGAMECLFARYDKLRK